jgi:hypothetical protein
VVEVTMEFAEAGEAARMAKAISTGTYEVWSDRARYDRTVYTPAGTSDYYGYYNNSVAQAWMSSFGKEHGMRDRGFVAFVGDSDGWGCAFARSGGGDAERVSMCAAHNTWHHVVVVPQSRVLHQRLVGLPPEIVAHLTATMKLQDTGDVRQIRIGTEETFEGQPFDPTSSERGLPISGRGMKLREHPDDTGRKCVEFRGTVGPGSPQVLLQPNARYRVEATLKATAGEAWVEGRTYEWSPADAERHSKWYGQYISGRVSPEDGWRKVSFDIETNTWDPFLYLQFRALSGPAYMERFWLRRVDTKEYSDSTASPDLQQDEIHTADPLERSEAGVRD